MPPLLILDCDEVILDFVGPLRDWLHARHAMTLRLESFSLAGNIRRLADNSVVDSGEFPALLDGFFSTGQTGQRPVSGVLAALEQLRAEMDIVILTNIPPRHHGQRIEVLRGHGIDFPVHANSGPKGERVARLAAGRRALFVDDLPPNHQSVAQHAPTVGRLHMVTDPELRPLIPPTPHAHARIDAWAEALPWIRARMKEGALHEH